MNFGGKISILVTLSRDSFRLEKGKIAKEILFQIENLIQNEEDIKKCISIAITKTEKTDTIENFFKFIKTEESSWLVDYFMEEGKQNVFFVPKPDKEGVYNNFTDYEKAINIFKNNYVDSPNVDIVFDNQGISQINILTNSMIEEIKVLMIKFNGYIVNITDNEDDPIKLENLEQKLNSLINSAKNGLNQFNDKIFTLFNSESQILHEKINMLISWKDFLINTLGDEFAQNTVDIDFSDVILNLSNRLNSIIKKKKLIQENKTQREEFEKIMDEKKSIYKTEKENIEKQLLDKQKDEIDCKNQLISITNKFNDDIETLKKNALIKRGRMMKN